jgi:Family of unknown function (DUF5372)
VQPLVLVLEQHRRLLERFRVIDVGDAAEHEFQKSHWDLHRKFFSLERWRRENFLLDQITALRETGPTHSRSARWSRTYHVPMVGRISPSLAACTSARIAASPDAGTRLVRVTHPFHPLSGRRLVCVGERYNRYGKRLLLRVDEDRVCSAPPQWTDLVAPDPEVVIGEGRSLLLRFTDLVELAELVSRLVEERRTGQRKGNNAADVKQTPPLAHRFVGDIAERPENLWRDEVARCCLARRAA